MVVWGNSGTVPKLPKLFRTIGRLLAIMKISKLILWINEEFLDTSISEGDTGKSRKI